MMSAHNPATQQIEQVQLMTMSEISVRQSDEKFVVRFPDGMRDRISSVAKSSHRSMNAEIVYRMQSTIDLENEVKRLKAIIDVLLSGQQSKHADLFAVAKEA